MNFKNLNILCGIVALFILSACGQPPQASINAQSINLSSDSSFSGSSGSVAVLAIATNDIDSRTGSEIVYDRSGSARTVTLSFADLNTATTSILGLTSCDLDNNSCTIQVAPMLNPDTYSVANQPYIQVMLQEVLVHEIGHTFGFGHFTDPTHVMYKYENNDNVDPDRLDTFVSNLTNFRENGDSTGYPTLASAASGDTEAPDFVIITHPAKTAPMVTLAGN
jgi:hypothetical protein